jgi:hypothetical protein
MANREDRQKHVHDALTMAALMGAGVGVFMIIGPTGYTWGVWHVRCFNGEFNFGARPQHYFMWHKHVPVVHEGRVCAQCRKEFRR